MVVVFRSFGRLGMTISLVGTTVQYYGSAIDWVAFCQTDRGMRPLTRVIVPIFGNLAKWYASIWQAAYATNAIFYRVASYKTLIAYGGYCVYEIAKLCMKANRWPMCLSWSLLVGS